VTALLTASGISKAYGGVRVLQDVDFELRAGEVHALVGENGAGKSTFIKIVSGAVKPDGGELRLDGIPLALEDPRDARRRGISCVYQEFTLVPDLSAADNIALGRERGPLLHRAETRRAAVARLAELGAVIDPDAPVRTLSIAHQQMVEMARALETSARVLILDEPTATLPGPDVDRLLDVVRGLRSRGLGVIYVSHRFEEVFAIADRITVLRDGRHVATTDAPSVDRAGLIRWMVGRDVSEEFPPRDTAPGATVLQVRDLSAPGRFSGVTFEARAGEILGIAGLVGAGRTSLGLALAGALRCEGTITVGGRPTRFASPSDAIDRGLAYLTEDRKAFGLLPLMSTTANITLTYLREFARAGLLDLPREREVAEAVAREVNVRGIQLSQPAGTLSGGTQQKALIGRLVLEPRTILVLDEPTRGVDVGARAEIYALMNRLTARGTAIIMISSDLPELLGMADRVLVMRNGRPAGELSRQDATSERVMALATGA
jgi:ABC-type sugar transport system ATPase subunit